MNKLAKRALGLFLALVMIAGMVPMAVNAAGPVQITVTSVTGTVGSTVTVPVTISTDSRACSANISISFDNTKLQYVSGSSGSLLTSVGATGTVNNTPVVNGTTSTVKAAFMYNDEEHNGYGLADAGILFNFKLKILTGSLTTITATATIKDYDSILIPSQTIPGTIGPPSVQSTITFNSNGGTAVDPITNTSGTVIQKPADPTKTGYTFAGWYKEAELTNLVAWPYTLTDTSVTFYAKWNINSYDATFIADGATVATVSTVFGQAIQAPAVPAKAGYSGVWNPVPGTMGAGPQTFTAVYTANTYTATYKVDDATHASYSVKCGDAIPVPTDPSKEGYTFLAWDPVPGTMGAGDATFTATFQVNNYTAYYMIDGMVKDSYSVPFGAAIPRIADPAKAGYTFKGWDSIPDTMPARNIYITAQWEEIPTSTIYFDSTGGTQILPITQYEGTLVQAPADPQREGFEFQGWVPQVPAVMPVDDVTCVAQWKALSYTITWDDGMGGTTTSTVDYGVTPVPPTLTRDHYDFDGWDPAIVPVTGNTTYVAKWVYVENPTSTISFNSAGGTAVASITQDEGTEVTAPANPSRTGYTFLGWDPAVPATMPVNDVICVAQWKINSYTITWDDGSGNTTTTSVDYGTVPQAPALTKTGFTLTGWDKPIVAATENTTYVAQWTIITFQIKFDAAGGVGGVDLTVDYGVTPQAPEVTKEGYTFAGWDKAIVAATENTTYTAQWTVKSYTITFDANGGIGGGDQTVDYGVIPQAPTVTKEGYTFAGWDKEIVAVTGVTTYTAQWTIKTFQIKFDAAGGVGGVDLTVDYGVTPQEPTVTREGYTFAGWDKAVVAATENATYTAQWTIKTFQIKFDAAGGVGGTELTVDYGVTPQEPTVTREGYTFAGWDKPVVAATENATYTAQWTIKTFTITWDDGIGGTTTTTVDYGVKPATADPVRSGYIFKGWSPEPVEATENTTYTATWEKDNTQFTITYVVDGATIATATGETGTPVPAQAAPTKAGYIFFGWSPAVPSTFPAADLTVTAVWYKPGDLSGDGQVTQLDALMALQGGTGELALTPEQIAAADVNHDGKLSAIDALMILHYSTGKLAAFPV